MALLVDKKLENGIELNKCYAKIGSIYGDKNYINFSLDYYYNKEYRVGNSPSICSETYGFNYALEDKCIIDVCYEYLKTLDDFENAIDVIE